MLEAYRNKRDFDRTDEPPGEGVLASSTRRFVVQEHHATSLHYDLRLELDGVLKSWAVPKGPSFDPGERRLAVRTEDHPLEYLSFEGHIADGNYGAGDMVVWDSGTWVLAEGVDAATELATGNFKVEFHGGKMRGKFALIHMVKTENQWLLIKEHDQYVAPDWKIEPILPWNSNKSRPADSADIIKRDRPNGSGDRANIDGEREARMPRDVRPMLATQVDEPFSDPNWIFEIKWDGFRGLCYIDDGRASLVSRNNIDLSERYPALVDLPSKLLARMAVLDGELVALDSEGRARFEYIQTALKADSAHPVVYYAFDLLYCDGFDLTRCRLIDRKRLLSRILSPDNHVRFSDHIAGNGAALYEQAKIAGIEGIMAKRADSHYESRRSDDWRKVKIFREADVVIAGYTEPRGSRRSIGALIAGVYDGPTLVPVGHVSVGTLESRLIAIHERLHPMEIAESTFENAPKTNEKAHWVKPELVAVVRFADWTADHQMRHPLFLRFREDKKPEECKFEMSLRPNNGRPEQERSTSPSPAARIVEREAAKSAARNDEVESLVDANGPLNVHVTVGGHEVSLTNLDKVYWPDDGYTKRDLIVYYHAIAPVLLPHLKDRPLILRRHPSGIQTTGFFQHDVEKAPPFVDIYLRQEDGKTIHYVVCNNAATLIYLANLGTISLDAWLSRVDTKDPSAEPHLDYIVFDLDPDGVPMEGVCEVALAIRDRLGELGLSGYPKTSGASGIHVYVPVERGYDFSKTLETANIIAGEVERRKSTLVTLQRRIRQRGANRVYLDCYQNGKGKSVACAYAVRARPKAPVSAPLTWDEVERCVEIADFTIENMLARVRERGDLFNQVLTNKQRIPALVG